MKAFVDSWAWTELCHQVPFQVFFARNLKVGETRSACRILIGKSEGRKPHARSKRRI